MSPSSKHTSTRHKKRSSRVIAGAPGSVRIIGGRWRGRKLSVPDVDGLRPTGDRMRETLFNWLQPHVAGARCLDLFAGSGALGFEALSRYAASVVFVESDAKACEGLAQSAKLLSVHLADDLSTAAHEGKALVGKAKAGTVRAENDSGGTVAQLYSGQALQALNEWQLNGEVTRFDLVFIDPPFRLSCQWDMLKVLSASFLADNALVYIESPSDSPTPESMPAGCKIRREKGFGSVTAYLVHHTLT